MKNLYEYLLKNLSRSDPYPVIDYKIRAEKSSNGDISFYIHADGRDSSTLDFWVTPDGQLKVKCSALCGCDGPCR